MQATLVIIAMNQKTILRKLTEKHPDISLAESDTFYWSPSDKKVYYRPDNKSDEGIWALLHESGHALLSHTRYYTDFELISMEVEAWEKAKELAAEMSKEQRAKSKDELLRSPLSAPRSFTIDEDHIQDCLDSYRNWLHKRSLCPDCSLSGIQTDSKTYSCIFCHKKWHVSSERFCRPYRSSK